MESQTQQSGQSPTNARFPGRRKLLSDRSQVIQIAHQIQQMLDNRQTGPLRALLAQLDPADLADVLFFLKDPQAISVFQLLDIPEQAELLDEVDDLTKKKLLKEMPDDRLAQILDDLHSDEDADILEALGDGRVDAALQKVEPGKADRIRQLLSYPSQSAGGIMSTGYIAVLETDTLAHALQTFRERTDAEPLYDLFVVDAEGNLKGVIGLRTLISSDPHGRVSEHMDPDVITVFPDIDQEQVARIFARYDLLDLPVIARPPEHKLLGVITSDDVIDVIQQENTEDFMRLTGSDAEEMERRSPARLALLRLPWIMATMFIEMGAGLVIRVFNPTLARVLLLASFMPIISAISGNTGLQSATIIVRGLSTGQIQVSAWKHAVLRQLSMTLILGAATGLTLGMIGAIWYGKLIFGVVVAVGMFAAVNIAGIVGTVVPLTSKRLGFDPAITSGPFETAFQDVVGISIFLGLATLLLRFLMK